MFGKLLVHQISFMVFAGATIYAKKTMQLFEIHTVKSIVNNAIIDSVYCMIVGNKIQKIQFSLPD